jgi:hypothetical protein
MNIDTLVESFYRKEEETESLINEVLRLLLTENDAPRSESFTFDLIPTIPVSELGWGALKTPEEGGEPVDPQSRQQLAQYLANIPGEDIRVKLIELNKFMNDEFQSDAASPADQLRQTISYLIFYKTLTQIITNFNASSAGFAFESFLAVLLDAQGGKQVPASAGSTIADIILTSQDGLPISLKLYKEGSLKVGGSYKQLVQDLTGDYPLMQYIVVTKDIVGEGPTAEGKLNFYAFNFTRDNFLEILATKAKEMDLLKLPSMFWAPIEDLEKAIDDGTLQDALVIPGRSEVDLSPVVAEFRENVISGMDAAGFEEGLVDEFSSEFVNLVDPETGIYRGTDSKRFAYGAAKSRMPGQRNLIKNISFNTKEEVAAFNTIMDAAYDKAVSSRQKLSGKSSARKDKIKDLRYAASQKSYKRLLELQREASPELFEAAMKSTIGYISNKQFELSKGDLRKIGNIKNQEDLFPYGEFDVGSIDVGVQKIQNVLDRSVNDFNKNVYNIFTDLKSLSSNLNGYVAGGLRDVGKANTAEKAATDIATGTSKIKE